MLSDIAISAINRKSFVEKKKRVNVSVAVMTASQLVAGEASAGYRVESEPQKYRLLPHPPPGLR